MNKKYRMISAAAAALLAVAPVASSVVSTVSADATTTSADAPKLDVTPGDSTPANAKQIDIKAVLSVTNVASLKDGASVSTAGVTFAPSVGSYKSGKVYILNVNEAGKVVDNAGKEVVVSSLTDAAAKAAAVDKFVAGNKYEAVLIGVTLNGLTAGAPYTINKPAGTTAAATDKVDTYGNISSPFNVESAQFSIPDPKKLGNPYVYEKGSGADTTGTVVTKGSIDYEVDTAAVGTTPASTSYNNSVKAIVDAIKAKYGVKVDDTSASAAAVDFDDLTAQVTKALADNKVKIGTDGTFAQPANSFVINLTATAANGKQVKFPVTLKTKGSTADYTKYPAINANGLTTDPVGGPDAIIDASKATDYAKWGVVPVNGTVDNAAIVKAFTAVISKGSSIAVPVSVDSSKVNTKVAGKYPVVVSATNPAGLTTKATFQLTVGDPAAKYSTVQYEAGLSVPVYSISGNNVTTTSTTIASGTQVATYGVVTVDGKNYTRINSKDSDQFIESKYVDGSYTPVNKVNKTVMHAAKVYDKTGKATGEKVATYATVTTYGDKIKLDNGKEAYRIGDNKYVLVGNIDGTSRVLNHNSYVYKTSKKRTTFNGSKKLIKGDSVTTYGSPVTLKNGVKYYRIGTKKFIKAVNAD